MQKAGYLYKANYPVCMCEGKRGMFFILPESKELANLLELGYLFLVSVSLRLAYLTKNCETCESLYNLILRPQIQIFSLGLLLFFHKKKYLVLFFVFQSFILFLLKII